MQEAWCSLQQAENTLKPFGFSRCSSNCLVDLRCVTLVVNILNYWTYAFSYLSLATYVYQLVCCVLLLTVQFGIFDRSLIAQEHMVMEQMYEENRFSLTVLFPGEQISQ